LKPITASVKRRVASLLFGSPVREARRLRRSTTCGSTVSLYSCLAAGGSFFTAILLSPVGLLRIVG
jgi:hypothetical protein